MKRLIAIVAALGWVCSAPAHAYDVQLLNVSYDPTREFYDEFNAMFAKHWQEKTGQELGVAMSHGGSGKQARSVIEGLPADIVTLALAYDIDAIAQRTDKLPADWEKAYGHNSAPSTSTIVFLVREGNPKNIRDWDDLVREDVKVITPNPKVSGGARWNYLAAWAYADQKFKGREDAIEDFMHKLYKNVPVLDAGARGATTTFVQRRIGDVLIAWESEAHLAAQQSERDFDVITPSISILAEPPVAMVEKIARRKGTHELANAYLQYLYSPEAQELAAKHHYRPVDKKVARKYAKRFPKLKLVTIREFGGWQAAQKKHFDDGGTFDRLYSQ